MIGSLLLSLSIIGSVSCAVWFFPFTAVLLLLAFVARIVVGVRYKKTPKQAGAKCLVLKDGNLDAKQTIFLIHGWPDNPQVWDKQVEEFGKDCRVVRIALPNFTGSANDPAFEPLGWNFDELSEMAGDAMREDLAETGQKSGVLVIHDWGSMIGLRAQHRYPELVSHVVVLDVVWINNKGPKAIHLPILIVLGLLYQYTAMTCWFLAVGVPFVGRAAGDALFHFFLQQMGKLPPTSLDCRPGPLSALMCYPYFYHHVETVSELLGLRPTHDKRVGASGPMCWEAGAVPTLFFYGADKGFQFHPKWFAKKLQARPECRVVPLSKGDQGCPAKVGHWMQVTAPDRVNSEIRKWLGI